MTKEQIIKELDFLIKDEKEAIDGYHDAIQKMSDSPRIVEILGHIYAEEVEHVRELDELKKAVENHEDFIQKVEVGKVFGMPVCDCYCGCDGDGIVFTEDKKED